MNLREVIARIEGLGWRGHWQGGSWRCRCPVHGGSDDENAQFKERPTGGIEFHCHSKDCSLNGLADLLKVPLAELLPPVNGSHPPVDLRREALATYLYADEHGRTLYHVGRFPSVGEKKKFLQWHDDAAGKPIWNLQGVRRVLWRLSELLKTSAGQVVLIAEGEKDVLTAERLGFAATTNAMGAGKWLPEYTRWLAERLADRRFVILPDNDPEGEKHAAAVFSQMTAAGLEARIVRLPGLDAKGDLSDWAKGGGTHGDLLGLIDPQDTPSVVSVVTLLPKREPPQALEPEALYGLPGLVVATIRPHTESADAGVLASFLVGVGCLLGPGPHIYRDGARHAGNEFLCMVGPSSVGRKGTATRRTDEIFKCLYDSNYTNRVVHDMRPISVPYSDLVLKGFGSGEALIEALADKDADRRRIVFETEFAKTIKVMRRENSTLSDTLRDAWDGGILANRTKGKQLIAKDTHIAFLGHITNEELKDVLGSREIFNGFANRFLWFYVTRSKLLPFGGGDVALAPVVLRIHEALHLAAKVGRMEFDEEATLLWDKPGGMIYDMLSEERPGLIGTILGRGASHVLRLCVIYALLDGDSVIRLPHLMAALAVWDYSVRSSEYIFGVSTGDDTADLIEELLVEAYPGYLTRKEIRDAFSRNAKPGAIPNALQALEAAGVARKMKIEGAGRHAEAWVATMQKGHDRNDGSPPNAQKGHDRNDGSPLEHAREFVKDQGWTG